MCGGGKKSTPAPAPAPVVVNPNANNVADNSNNGQRTAAVMSATGQAPTGSSFGSELGGMG